jgi:hypothetical protein
MNEDHAVSRREFLMLAAAAAASLLVRSQLPGVMALRSGQQALLPTQLAALLRHQASAKVIGREYLSKYGQEADARVLLDHIAASLAVSDVGRFAATGQGLRELLDRTVREDFAVDRVVMLRGWVLSVTEARLCALAALL